MGNKKSSDSGGAGSPASVPLFFCNSSFGNDDEQAFATRRGRVNVCMRLVRPRPTDPVEPARLPIYAPTTRCYRRCRVNPTAPPMPPRSYRNQAAESWTSEDGPGGRRIGRILT